MNRKQRNEQKMKARVLREIRFEYRVMKFLDDSRRHMALEDARAAVESAQEYLPDKALDAQYESSLDRDLSKSGMLQ